jgi:uncharacterized protein (DUF302 family)
MSVKPRYGFSVDIDLTVGDAESRVRELLKEEGFGVLTEIDVQSTLKDKLNVDFKPYKILGACNPLLSHRALLVEPGIGLLLPCNVVVEAGPSGGSRISFLDPGLGRQPRAGADRQRRIASAPKNRRPSVWCCILCRPCSI